MSEAPPKEKKKPDNIVIPPKKPKLSKAERRAKQEAERAAKAARGGKPKEQQQQITGKKAQGKSDQEEKKEDDHSNKEQYKAGDTGDSSWFSTFAHLPPYIDPLQHADEFSGVTLGGAAGSSLDSAVLKLGLLYAQGVIRGGNARCRSMLRVYCQLIGEYDPPASAIGDLRPHLDSNLLKPAFQYWTEHCRPHSVSMGNAFTFLKSAVASLERNISLGELKEVLQETIEAYIRERMEFADKAIAGHVSCKIVNGDVLLVYGHSEVILKVLLEQKELNKQFRVICVDSRPLLEGRKTLLALREAGIPCTYILLNCISYVMKDVTKVLLGASALMTDGSLLGRVGTACVALTAQRKSVLVCCETYKISNRVQLESITGNELGDPNLVYEGKQESLRMLNLLYDLTPSNYISGIVTEMGIVPPTSVAVLLREMNPNEII
jgi:translation initiation factor eIF-2B subunit delta